MRDISITLFGILSRIAAYCGFGGKGHVVGFGLETNPRIAPTPQPLLKSHVGQNICPRNVFGIESQNSFQNIQHIVLILTLSIFALLGCIWYSLATEMTLNDTIKEYVSRRTMWILSKVLPSVPSHCQSGLMAHCLAVDIDQDFEIFHNKVKDTILAKRVIYNLTYS